MGDIGEKIIGIGAKTTALLKATGPLAAFLITAGSLALGTKA